MSQTSHIDISLHAQSRLQQRGIPVWYVDLLVTWGSGRHDGHGAQVYEVTKAARKRMERVLPRQRYVLAERYFGVYAVVSGEGTLITVAHRQGRTYLH